MQNYWLHEASIHGQLNQQALLQYPEYDFSVSHPTSNLGTKLQDSLERAKQRKTLGALARNTGLLFFYRARNPIDLQQIPILRDFCKAHHFSLIPVSVDGGISPDLPNTRHDRGQADSLHVRYFPAVLLVNPKTQQTLPVAYGLTTQDVLTAHLMFVVKQFQGETI
jgi:conjugal transfer pilus assembly protein TraF